MNLRQKIFLGIVVVANATAWIMQSDVAKLVARDRPVLLGRYSRSHFTAILVIFLISVIGLYIDQARTRETYKRRWFQVIATLLFLIPGFFLLDFGLRFVVQPAYVHDSRAYHRPAGAAFEFEFVDAPEAGMLMQAAPPGHPPVRCHFDVDAWGYRNKNVNGPFDVVTLGDSFTEGCNVSDGDAWPVHFAELTAARVYNLGMTGYDPLNERVSLELHAPRLKPAAVIMMLYEGNDFEVKRKEAAVEGIPFRERFKNYFKQSPLSLGYERLIVGTFNTGAGSPDPRLVDAVSWLPVRIPDDDTGHLYAFGPKALLEATHNAKAFAKSRRWQRTAEQLRRINAYCTERDIRFMLAFAPTKAHVVIPMLGDRLPVDKVHAFAEIFLPLIPKPEEFGRRLLENLDARARVVADWCHENEVEFFDLTPFLREQTAAGEFVYFTYDHHWTPRGNALVAGAVAERYREWINPPGDVVDVDSNGPPPSTGNAETP